MLDLFFKISRFGLVNHLFLSTTSTVLLITNVCIIYRRLFPSFMNFILFTLIFNIYFLSIYY